MRGDRRCCIGLAWLSCAAAAAPPAKAGAEGAAMSDPGRELVESAGVDVLAIVREHQKAGFSRLCGEVARLAEEQAYDQARAQFPREDIHLDEGRIPFTCACRTVSGSCGSSPCSRRDPSR
jgi:hypothetical protein